MINIIEKLRQMGAITEYLDKGDQSFARSMTNQLARQKSLSDKQWHWWDVLVERGTKAKEAALNPDLIVTSSGIEVGSFQKVKEFLLKSKMRWPALKFTFNSRDYRIYIAGDRARVPGRLVLQTWIDRGAGVKNRIQMGHFEGTQLILTDGLEIQPEEILIAYLQLMSCDLMEAIRFYGIETGHCVFCSIPLTDPRSQEVGYGQVCAGHHNLPWG